MSTNTGETFEVPTAKGAQPMKEATAAKVGFRELTPLETDLVRQVRATGVVLEHLIGQLQATNVDVDTRWMSIARTHFQEGLMAAVRSITKPAFF